MWHPAKPLLENRVVFFCIASPSSCIVCLNYFEKPSFALYKHPSLFQRQNPERIGYFISLKTICKVASFSNKQDQTNTYLKTYTLNPIPTQSYSPPPPPPAPSPLPKSPPPPATSSIHQPTLS